MIAGCVIMAGKDSTQPLGLQNGTHLVLVAKLRLQPFQVRHMFSEVIVIHATLLSDIGAQGGQVAELALAGGVIHQADDPDTVIGRETGQFFEQGFRTNLCAQVQEVADLEHTLRAGRQKFVGDRARIIYVAPFA